MLKPGHSSAQDRSVVVPGMAEEGEPGFHHGADLAHGDVGGVSVALGALYRNPNDVVTHLLARDSDLKHRLIA